MNKLTTIGMVLVLSAMVIVAGCTQGSSGSGEVAGSANEVISLKAAPSFTVETIEGRTVSSEEYKAEDKPMVLYFMASTCTTCAKNWKNIDEVYPEYKGKVDLVAVSVDPTDDVAVLKKLSDDRGFTFETVAGNPQLAVEYDVKKQTAKFAIDKDGNIVSRHDGLLTPEEWRELFESVL